MLRCFITNALIEYVDHPIGKEGNYKDSKFYSKLGLPLIQSSHLRPVAVMERTAEDTICMRSEEAPRKEFIPVRRRPQGRDVCHKSRTTGGRKKDDFEWLTSHLNTMDLYCSIRKRNLPAKSKVCHYKCLCITLGMQSSTPWADVSQTEPLQKVCVNDPLLVHQKTTALAKSTT